MEEYRGEITNSGLEGSVKAFWENAICNPMRKVHKR